MLGMERLGRRAVGLLLIHAALSGSLARARDATAVIEQARAAVAAKDARRAAELLEVALVRADAAERRTLRDQLRTAYEAAASEADAAGDRRAAGTYRDNLAILNRSRPAPAAPATPPPAPRPEVAAPTPAVDAGLDRASAEVNPPASPTEPAALKADDLAAADAAFRAPDYAEAGRIYAALSKAGELPPSRNDHWAYCRCIGVVRRINAVPKPAEWAEIHAEIAAIRKLAPKNWFGEYLRDLAAQRSGTGAGTPRPSGLIVRGSDPDPDEAPPPRDPIDGAADSRDPALGNWQVLTTANFRVLHDDPALAVRVSEAAEGMRDELFQRWTGSAAPAAWTPRCDLYVYPSESVYRQRTGQPAGSPGFSTIGLEGSRVVARRVNLRADHPTLVDSVLPHELTHVVLADLFGGDQVPRWADEGAAQLAEPETERATREAVLDRAVVSGELFRLATLMETDYPNGRHWDLFCAQGGSLARFLVARGTPAQFVEFARGCAGAGVEAELARLYGINGLEELERLWMEWARAES